MIISTQINPAERWNIIYTADITLARHKVGTVLPTFKVKKIYIFYIYCMQNTGKVPVCELDSPLKSLLHGPSDTTSRTSIFAVNQISEKKQLKGGKFILT